MDPDNLVIKLILNGGEWGGGSIFKHYDDKNHKPPSTRYTSVQMDSFKKISPPLPVHGHRSHFLYNLLTLRQSTKPRHTQTHTAIQTVKKTTQLFPFFVPFLSLSVYFNFLLLVFFCLFFFASIRCSWERDKLMTPPTTTTHTLPTPVIMKLSFKVFFLFFVCRVSRQQRVNTQCWLAWIGVTRSLSGLVLGTRYNDTFSFSFSFFFDI